MKTYNIEQIDEYFTLLAMDKSPHTIVSYQGSIDKLFKFLNVITFDDVKKITSGDIRLHQANLKSGGMSFSSINTNIRPLRAMFNWLVENDYMKKTPIEKVKDLKEPKKIRDFLTDEEQLSMIGACKKESDRLIISLFLTTGMRRDELCKLKLNSYDGSHILIEGKGSKQRKLALMPEVILLLNKYLEYRNKKYGNSTDALIVSTSGNHFTGDAIYKKVKNILNLAGLSEDRIEAIHTHSLRHSFVARLFDSGVDIYSVQRLCGHANLSSTMIYSHISNKALDKTLLNQKSIL